MARIRSLGAVAALVMLVCLGASGCGTAGPADPRRVAIGGISMGGFGALDLAERMPGRWCAVGPHSPALWQRAGETAPGAFDDAQDFEAHDVIATAATPTGEAALAARPLWIDAGESDPFLPGGHDDGYRSSRWPAYLAFYATALARCA